MKKLIVTAVLSVVLGTSCMALADSSQERKNLIDSIRQKYHSGRLHEVTYDQIENLLRTQEFRNAFQDLDTDEFRKAILARLGEGLEQGNTGYGSENRNNIQPTISKQKSDTQDENFGQKIYDSITGSRTVTAVPKKDSSWFLLGPQFIYDKTKKSYVATQIPTLVDKIITEENYFRPQSRDSINHRSQYAAVIDKAVSLQAFQETENRLSQITQLLMDVDETKDLKSIAELQARIKAMLAMIQNETAKLQTIAHLRNAEQALISQLKRERNIGILNSQNKQMPIIRPIR
ncbi:type IV secretion system protein [Bartonella taylorii]|uniref:type IV secretion system protein n=1 Tax=Bartonella taylorii TaxID=33046 RepID=UPI001FEDDB50|nr:type IV secretion system protein [Bartonella taylorii]